jgi:hypothetical protein
MMLRWPNQADSCSEQESRLIGISLGIVYATAFMKWLIEKNVLHGLGRDRRSFGVFPCTGTTRRPASTRCMTFNMPGKMCSSLFSQAKKTVKTKEAIGLFGASLLHLPLLPLAPFFIVTVWAWAANDDRLRRRSHLDSVWAEEHVPRHVGHHLAKIRMQTGASRGRWRIGSWEPASRSSARPPG